MAEVPVSDAPRHERELYVLVPPYGSEHRSMSRQAWRLLKDYRWSLLVFTFVGLAAGLGAFWYQTPVYVLSATLAPAEADNSSGLLAGLESQVGGLAALAGITLGDSSQTKEEAIAILKSKTFAYDFLSDRNLLPELFPEDWDASAKKWVVDAEDVPTMGDAWELFDKQIRFVREDRRTGLVTLSVAWTDREEAADWIRDMVSRLNERMRRRAVQEAETSLSYLNRELDKSSSIEVRQAIYRLIETQVKKVMLANVRAEYAMRIIDPPVVPDADEFDRPELWPSLALGGLGGLLLGLIIVAIVRSRRPRATGPAAAGRSVGAAPAAGPT